MLSRIAENLYWMARYMERAENTARMLDIAHRMSLMPTGVVEPAQEWDAPLLITGAYESFFSKYAARNEDNVLRYLALDPENTAGILASLEAARENARSVRGSITSEMWEDLNATWLEVRDMTLERVKRMGVREFFEWVKSRSHLFRGVTHGTMLRDEAFRFIRLGTFIERADSTARILDVKYHILLPSIRDVGGAADYYQWGALLRSVSAFQAYRKVYRDQIKPVRVAELLILREDMPRSLHACMNEVHDILAIIGNPGEPQRLAGELHAALHYG
ncbi:MAG TPA: alpha-E domain-containing protein, partial [Burkholderiales bacterium]